MSVIKYFINEEELKKSDSTCYFEFQQGHYHDQCWLPDSISIHDTLWDEFDLSILFARVIGEFDCFGITAVRKEQWNDIVRISQESHSPWRAIIAEAAPWVDRCFKDHEVFTILGI